MTQEEAKRLVQQIRNAATQAYATQNLDEGGRLLHAMEVVQDWIDAGMSGPLPVKPEDLGIVQAAPPIEETPVSVQAPVAKQEPPVATQRVEAPPPAPVSDSTPHAEPVHAEPPPVVQATAVLEEKSKGIEDRERIRRQARESKERGDLEQANRYWRQLLEIAPGDTEAERELQQHAKEMSSQVLGRKMLDLRRKVNVGGIRDLDDALRLAREILTSPNLDESMQAQAQEMEDKARAKRAALKAASGEIETMAGLGQLKGAISQLEDFINKGVFEFEDREGQIIPTSDKLREYNQEYAAFCTQKAREYLDRSQLSLPAFPKAADDVLKQALEQFDKADPGARTDLERRRAEVGELITRWDLANSLIAEATAQQDPERRLGLLQQAVTTYDGVENLKVMLEEARRDAAGAVVNSVKNIYDRARYLLAQGDLDKAQQEAMKARVRAGEMRGASEALDAELAKIDQLMVDISNEAEVIKLVGDARASVDKYLEQHDYEAAAKAIELLPENVHQHREIKIVEDQITRRRGAAAMYKLALRRFEIGDYPGVLSLLEPKEEDMDRALALDPRADDLRRRASARQAYAEGVALLHEDMTAAKASFELARISDTELSAEVKPYLEQIAGWEGKRSDVQAMLDNAARLAAQNPPRWATAFVTLNEAKDLDSPLRTVALEKWLAVRESWRTELLEELKGTASDSERAHELISLLRANGLLDKPEDQALVDSVDLDYRRSRGRKAAESKPPRWQEAIDAWRAYLEIDRDDMEAQVGLRDALRSLAMEDASVAFSRTKDSAKSLDMLDERQQDPYLQTDPQFLAEMVRQACQFAAFDRAEKYLESLRMVEPEGSSLVQDREHLLRQARAWDQARASSDASFAEGRYLAAVKVLDDVIAAYPLADGLRQWQSARDEVQRRAVNALLEKARQQKVRASGLDRVEVISLYSQVIQLVSPGKNQEAEAGIAEVQGELPGLVRNVVDEADRFNPDNRDPYDALRDAESFLGKLNDFRAVTPYMGQEKSRWERNIEDTTRKLSGQRDTLLRVHNLLTQVRTALRSPTDDKVLTNAEGWLRDAKRDLPKALGISDLETQLKQTKAERAQIKGYVDSLKTAAQTADDAKSFQTIQDVARSLKQVDPEDRYQLQGAQNLDVYDDFLDKHVSSLEDHERLARERLENFRIYSEWEKKSVPQHHAFVAAEEEVKDKRLRGSLEDLQEAIDRALAIAQRALETYSKRPTAEPQSYPAADIRDEITEWQAEAEEVQAELATEKDMVARKREERNAKDKELSILTSPSRKPVMANKSQAERCLQEIRRLDPNWPDLPAREKKVQVWKESSKGRFSFGPK